MEISRINFKMKNSIEEILEKAQLLSGFNIDDTEFDLITLDDNKPDLYYAEVRISDNQQQYAISFEFIEQENNIHIKNLIETTDLVEKKIKENKLSFDIDYWSYNVTYDHIARLKEEGRIIVPEMQRGFVWEQQQASKLIESILMGLPLPSLFLIKQDDGKYLVIDGLQRITTIHAFIYNKSLPHSKKNGFKLSGVNERLLGKSYDDIKTDISLKDRLDMGTINVIEFKQNKPQYEEAMYLVFERLNSGGTILTPQQIRNSIYYGTFNTKLNSMSDELLKKYFSEKQQLSLATSELLLRTIAIYDLMNEREKIPATVVYKTQLNATAEKYHLEYKKDELSKDNSYETKIADMFSTFKTAICDIESIFGEKAFKKYLVDEESYTNRISPILFESIITSYCLYKDKYKQKEKEEQIIAYNEIFKSQGEYEQYFTQATGLKTNIIGRIETMKKVLFKNEKTSV